SWLTVPALVGPLVGPPIGGFITTYLTWHWIFLINVPIGLLGIWLATRYLPETAPAETPPLDFPGFVLSGLAASGVVFGLSVVSLPALPPMAGFITVAVGLISGVLYLIHARRAKNPLLALELFRNQVFRSSVLGGSLFRIGIGAVPFLLPLMFQIGFGLTPFQSGMITFVSAIGAIGMKFVTALLFRIAGFRRVLIWGSLVAAASIAIYGLFTPQTPYVLMLAILLVGGFIRSMFFTGVNALSYAEITAADTSKATPITAVFQQLSIALGVALAGGILEVSTSIHGGALTLGDFHIAFFIVAAVSAAASITFMRLAPEAGSAVSGHGRLATPKTLETVSTAGK
ncbi:MFS transporter, partial [Mesorhizobium sp.]